LDAIDPFPLIDPLIEPREAREATSPREALLESEARSVVEPLCESSSLMPATSARSASESNVALRRMLAEDAVGAIAGPGVPATGGIAGGRAVV